MQVDIHSGPSFALGEITLPPGGAVRVEAGAMAMTRGDVQMNTSTRGGFMKGLRRTLGGESFFVNDFASERGGVVGVAAVLPGDMTLVPLDGSGTLLVQSGSWTASDVGIDVDAKWGGGRSFFSGEGLVLLRCTGAGDLLMSSYGAIRRHDLASGEPMTLDTGHVVAFDESVQYNGPQGRQLEVHDPRRRGAGHRLHRPGPGLVPDPQHLGLRGLDDLEDARPAQRLTVPGHAYRPIPRSAVRGGFSLVQPLLLL